MRRRVLAVSQNRRRRRCRRSRRRRHTNEPNFLLYYSRYLNAFRTNERDVK